MYVSTLKRNFLMPKLISTLWFSLEAKLIAGYRILFASFSGKSTHFSSLPLAVKMSYLVLKMNPTPRTNPVWNLKFWPLLTSMLLGTFVSSLKCTLPSPLRPMLSLLSPTILQPLKSPVESPTEKSLFFKSKNFSSLILPTNLTSK